MAWEAKKNKLHLRICITNTGGFSSFSPGGQPCEGAGGRGVPPARDADAVAAHLLFALMSGEASRKAGVFVRSPPESHTRRPHQKPGSPAVVECVVHYQIVNRHQARHLGLPMTSRVVSGPLGRS